MSNISTLEIPPLPKPEISLTKPSYFIIDSLLHSRVEAKFPTNTSFHDEDVNIYLSHLLTSLMNPEYQENLCKYVIPYDTKLFETLRTIDNPRFKYRVYKFNADYLLVMSGIFDNPKGKRTDSKKYLYMGKDSFVGRGKAYYSIASSYLTEATRSRSALSEVLQKLSRGFEDYLHVLSYMRGEYLNIIRKISEGEIYHFKRSISPSVEKSELKKLHNEMLDIYSQHLQNPSDDTRNKLCRTVEKIKRIDPYFRFKIKS